MTAIPDDIRATAYRIAKEAIYNGGVDWAADDFAEALMQERERCAKIAAGWRPSSWGDEVFAAKTIADLIRSQTP